jgi:isoleucyl-tRNA synthetase
VSDTPGHPYPDVPSKLDLPTIERAVLSRWRADGTFRASIEQRALAPEFVFYDGPPFANGLPHYGHLLTGFVKDAVPRYRTMRGQRVDRRFGWDCHGLPAEMEAERELGVSGKLAIEDLGVGRFNDYCRSLVLRTADAWERYVERQARWVDFADDYKTMDLPFMESVMWAFKRLFERGLVYEGRRVLPYCWECETPLSNFETRQDDAYRLRTDLAVTVLFPLLAADDRAPEDADDPLAEPFSVMVWTTTPWTLPSNQALAVGATLRYDLLERPDGRRVLIAAERRGAYAEWLGDARLVAEVPGERLLGRRYQPLFPFFADAPGSFVVLDGSEFVTVEEGTGIVHMAPGFGEEDQRCCEAAGIALVCPMDERGRFTDEVPPWSGTQVFDANPAIVEDLAKRGLVVDAGPFEHSYPHCWRSDTPLVYRAISSWFIAVSSLRDRLVELNRQIAWTPEHVGPGAFGKWLEGARDWSVSRNRFWGSPIPVWKSDDPAYPRIDVYGSLDELEADFGVRPTDLHRPAVDELTRPNPDDPTGRSTMRRVPEVLDCWFESGSMPFAQVHYPFEQREWFEAHFPADFIVEYIGQTRGWFYTLHVLATALFDRPPFRSCIAHGIVLGTDGRKASKRLGNYPDPEEMFERHGADSMRWALLSSPVLRGADLIVDEKLFAEATRRGLLPLWNAWYFFTLYANTDGVRARLRTDQTGLLDRYILAKTAEATRRVTDALEHYDLSGAIATVEELLEVLDNWYIRRSRDRFWSPAHSEGAEAKHDAYDTLATVLEHICRLAAPLAPMLTETIWQGLTGGRSVHLADWPDPSELPGDPELVAAMDLARSVCSAAHSIRKAAHLRSRLPLRTLTVAGPEAARLAGLEPLIADEVNVGEVRLSDTPETATTTVLSVNPAALGPRLGPETQRVLAAVRAGEWEVSADSVVAGGVRLEPGEFTLEVQPRDPGSARVLPGTGIVVELDLTVTPEAERVGQARDVVRQVQQARRDLGLEVADRIRLVLRLPDSALDALRAQRDWVAEQTLAVTLDVEPVDHEPAKAAGGTVVGHLHDGQPFEIEIERAESREAVGAGSADSSAGPAE